MYGFPSGYNPFLGKSRKPDPPPIITEATKQAARQQGAEYISRDGTRGYKWLYDEMYEAHGPGFDSWWLLGEQLPAGELVEL